ncbi:MAG: hypothetical protein ABJE87_07255, partial [Roseobacter sp.]
LQRELIKQCCLRFLPWSHHRQIPQFSKELNQRMASRSRKSFSTQSAQTCRSLRLQKAKTGSLLLKPAFFK